MKELRRLLIWLALISVWGYTQAEELAPRLQRLERENQNLQLRLQALEARQQEEQGLLPSYRGLGFTLGGELELEYVDTQNGTGIDNPYGYFQVDKFTLLPSARISDTVTLEALTLFKGDKASLSEVYAIFTGLPYASQLTVGLDDRFINEWPPRRTESFALIETAFARDDTIGLVWERKKRSFFWHLSLTNGYALADSSVSEDGSHKMIHDNRTITDSNDNKVIGLGLGYRFELGAKRSLALMSFGYQGRLSSDDISYLQGINGYGTSTDATNQRHGLAFDWRGAAANLGGKWISAQDGALQRSGWYIQGGYNVKLSGKGLFRALMPFVRYGTLDVGLPNDPLASQTWDRRMTTIALLAEISKGVKLKTEYYLNNEQSGGAAIDNDELMIQLEIKF